MLQKVLLETLEIRFTEMPFRVSQAVGNIAEIEKLRHLQRIAIQCASREDFEAEL